MKTLIATTALVFTAFTASAAIDTSAIDRYAPNADVSALSDAEVNLILSVIHSGGSEAEKLALVKALAK